MPLPSSLARVKNSITERGLLGTLHALLASVRIRVLTLRPPTHPFDLRHNVDTSGYIKGKNLHPEHLHASSSTAYWGTAPSTLKAILENWQQTLSGSPRDYTFIDIGCGKGRAIMVASDTPFQKIIGVELNPQLAAIAQKNLATWQTTPHACENVTVLNTDALTFPIPNSPLLFYLYHPFDPPVMQHFVDRLAALTQSHPAPIDLIYVHPLHGDLILGIPGASLLWAKNIPHSSEDAAADIFANRSDLCNLYRLIPHSHAPDVIR